MYDRIIKTVLITTFSMAEDSSTQNSSDLIFGPATDVNLKSLQTINCPRCRFEFPLVMDDSNLGSLSEKKIKCQPPWWTSAVEQAIFEKRRTLKISNQTGRRYDRLVYTQAKNFARQAVKRAKVEYNENLELSKKFCTRSGQSSEIATGSENDKERNGNEGNVPVNEEHLTDVLNYIISLVESTHGETRKMDLDNE